MSTRSYSTFNHKLSPNIPNFPIHIFPALQLNLSIKILHDYLSIFLASSKFDIKLKFQIRLLHPIDEFALGFS